MLVLTLSLLAPLSCAQEFVPRGQLIQNLPWIETLYPGDFDGDGDLEVIAQNVAFVTTDLSLWDRGPDGTWTATDLGLFDFISFPVISDVDGDGIDDFALAVEPFFFAQSFVYFGRADSPMFTAVRLGPTDLDDRTTTVVLDFDGDADQDVVVYTQSERAVYRNEGARTFTELSIEPGSFFVRGAISIDVDGDGLDDLVTASFVDFDFDRLVWERSLGSGQFAPAVDLFGTLVPNVWRMGTVDVDGDGDLDILCNESTGPMVSGAERDSFWVQLESGQTPVLRQDHSQGIGPILAVANVQDVDLDGVPDMLMHRNTQTPLVFRRGLGGGDFGTPVVIDVPDIRGAASVDVDGDGDMDIIETNGTWLENVATVSTAVCAGAPNSTGVPAELTVRGSRDVGVDRTTLFAANVPPGAFGMFVTSLDTAPPTPVANSQGTLCLGGSIGRFNRPGEVRAADAGGVLSLTLDLGDVPDPLTMSTMVSAPESRAFQLWYRDVSGGGLPANFSGAASVSFR